jgi:hypothetical protein
MGYNKRTVPLLDEDDTIIIEKPKRSYGHTVRTIPIVRF